MSAKTLIKVFVNKQLVNCRAHALTLSGMLMSVLPVRRFTNGSHFLTQQIGGRSFVCFIIVEHTRLFINGGEIKQIKN